MLDTKKISKTLQQQLQSLKRDGVSVVEAAIWLSDAGLFSEDFQTEKRLRSLLREGKMKGAYQFPNKRWVIVNNSRLPDGIQRVVPIKETAKTLKLSEKKLREFMGNGEITPLDFGPSPILFLEEEIKRFREETLEASELFALKEVTRTRNELDKLKRQLYYLRADVRLIAERIEELIQLLE